MAIGEIKMKIVVDANSAHVTLNSLSLAQRIAETPLHDKEALMKLQRDAKNFIQDLKGKTLCFVLGDGNE